MVDEPRASGNVAIQKNNNFFIGSEFWSTSHLSALARFFTTWTFCENGIFF